MRYKHLYLFPLLVLTVPEAVLGQAADALSLTIQGRQGTILRVSRRGEGPLLDFQDVDGLGASLNPHGSATFLPSLSGAVYEASVDITTRIPASLPGGQLTVSRSRPLSPTDLPADALYDAELSASFSNLLNANRIDDHIPAVINRTVPSGEQITSRKIGVFVSTDLPSGIYEADVIYTLAAP